MPETNMDFESRCESLAGDLSEQLRMPHSFIVTGPQYVMNRALREGLEAGMAGDSDGCILWISLGDIRMASMHRMMQSLASTGDLPRYLQITSPTLLMQQMACDSSGFLAAIRNCRRFLVWLHPVDFCDCALIQWLQIYAQLPQDSRAGVTYFWAFAQDPDWSSIRAIHGDIRRIDMPHGTEPIHPGVEFVEASSDSLELSQAFKEICQNSHTLVSCRFDKTRMRYSEWSHGMHVHVYGRDTEKLSHDRESYQFGVNDGMRAFIHDDRIFDHVVSIDPSPLDDITAVAHSWTQGNARATLIATSRFELLMLIASFPSFRPPVQPPHWLYRCYQAYSMFDALSRYEVIHPTSLYDRDFLRYTLKYWISQNYIEPEPPYAPTSKGRSLFPGIQHIDQLCGLFNYMHETRCESPGHQFCAYICADFMRRRTTSRFVLSGESWQRHFHHILNNESIIRPETAATPTAWLDSMPYICPQEISQRIEDLLYSQCAPDDLRLSDKAASVLAQMRQEFADAPAHRFLETTNGEAFWWTFAGAEANSAAAMLLKTLAPKLSISFGNLCLRISWITVRGDAQKAAERFQSLLSKMDELAKSPQNLPQSLPAEYLQNHPMGWMIPLMPQSLRDEIIADLVSSLRQLFTQGVPPVIVTDKCHQIDKLPFEFISFEPPAEPKPRPQYHPSKPEKPAPAPHPTVPVIPGVMHTRYPWTYIDNEPALNRAINTILQQPFIGLDVETTLYHQELCLIQIGCADCSFIIDPLRVDFSGLAQVFSHPQIVKIIHNATFEKTVLKKYGMQINNIVDTMRVSQSIYGRKQAGGHSLKAVCMREFGLDMDKTNQTSRWDLRPLTPHQLEYAALDAEILIHLYRHFCIKK